jgi:acetolactate synthase-1/2/3 large subunit
MSTLIEAAIPLQRPEPASARTVASAVLQAVAGWGATHVFGVPGGAVSPYLKLLRRSSSLRFVIGCHETGTAFMADGFTRMSDRLAVVLVTSGPGATNALTGIACAHAAGSPLIAISGQAATSHFHLGSIQESTSDGTHVVEIFRHACGASELVPSAAALPGALAKAARVCLGLPRQAAHLSFPLDVSAAAAPASDAGGALVPAAAPPPRCVDLAGIEYAAQAIARAHRPFLLLGAGCRRALRASPELRATMLRWLEAWEVPFATTAQAKGVLPESHPLALGVYGIAGSPRATAYLAASRPDVTLVVGSSLGEWTTRSWDRAIVPTRDFLQLDADGRRIGRSFAGITALVGEAGASLEVLARTGMARLAPAATRAARRAAISAARAIPPAHADPACESDATPIKPQRLMRELSRICDARTSLFIDSGNAMAWAIHYLQVDPPAELFVTTAVASMGWAVGAVIGAKLAAPDRACICLTGDGSFLMHGAEVATAARYAIGAVWIVLADNYLGMVNQGEAVTSPERPALDDPHYQLGDPDLAGLAEALGARAALVTTPAALEPALTAAVRAADAERRPVVVVVRIDPRELPPMGDRFASLAAQTSGARTSEQRS